MRYCAKKMGSLKWNANTKQSVILDLKIFVIHNLLTFLRIGCQTYETLFRQQHYVV